MSQPDSPPTAPARREPTLAEQARMVAALHRKLQQQERHAEVPLFETHISFVLVAGDSAYKIKKAVKLGFLDDSTLAARRHHCEEELRLNRRTAPALYLGVLPVTGTADEPVLGGEGEVIDWVVHMRSFAQDGLWDRVLARGELQPRQVDELAELLCDLHRHAAVAGANTRFGRPAQVRAPMLDNLIELERLLPGDADRQALAAVRQWEAAEFAVLGPVFEQRRRDGWVRECHGDLHLGNVVLIDGRTTVFDGIEFNDDFRWIDVVSDLAFMAMDLSCHARPDLARRLVNAVLEGSGDFAGARVLRYYQAYRALVRAKVAALRAGQPPASEAMALARGYLAQARACALDRGGGPAPGESPVPGGAQWPGPLVVMTHGFSGSGKTTATQALIESAGFIRIRADVERKRLFGLPPHARSGSALNAGLYTAEATAATQARLCGLAAAVVQAGQPVVLDASFLQRSQRDQVRRLAAQQGVPCFILDFEVDAETLRQRVRQRAAIGIDASEADVSVLEAQFRSAQPLADDERPLVVSCGPDGPVNLLQALASARGTACR